VKGAVLWLSHFRRSVFIPAVEVTGLTGLTPARFTAAISTPTGLTKSPIGWTRPALLDRSSERLFKIMRTFAD
jgi:hypothetical protein